MLVSLILEGRDLVQEDSTFGLPGTWFHCDASYPGGEALGSGDGDGGGFTIVSTGFGTTAMFCGDGDGSGFHWENLCDLGSGRAPGEGPGTWYCLGIPFYCVSHGED